MAVGETGKGVVVGLPGEFFLNGFADRDVLRNADNLFDEARGITFKGRFAAGEPDPMAAGMAYAVFQAADFIVFRMPHGFIMGGDHRLVIGVNQVAKAGSGTHDFFRFVTQHGDDFTIAEDGATLIEIINVKHARGGGGDAFDKVAALLQLEFGAFTFGDFAGDGLKTHGTGAVKHHLDILADPALVAVAVEDGEFVVCALLFAGELTHVEAFGGSAPVLPYQFEVGAAQDLDFSEMQHCECGLVTEGKTTLLVRPVDDIARQFNYLAVLFIADGEFLFGQTADSEIGGHAPAGDDDEREGKQPAQDQDKAAGTDFFLLPPGTFDQEPALFGVHGGEAAGNGAGETGGGHAGEGLTEFRSGS